MVTGFGGHLPQPPGTAGSARSARRFGGSVAGPRARGAALFPPHHDLRLGEDRGAAEKMLVRRKGERAATGVVGVRNGRQGGSLRPLAFGVRKRSASDGFFAENR